MSIITDACSLVNIYKARLDGFAQSDPCMRLCLGPVVTEEVWGNASHDGAFLVPRGWARELTEAVESEEFASFMSAHRLGPGESECIILAERYGYFMLSDDKRARRVAASILGEDRVLGTLGVALNLARTGSARLESVFRDYDNARRQGAFLPLHSLPSFTSAVTEARHWPCGPDCAIV